MSERPAGTQAVDGLVHRRSPRPVAETVTRVRQLVEAAGARVFCEVDHSGEAARVGQSLRDTKLVIFGNPAAGTPAMAAAPSVALDLPLKILVWADDDGAVWLTSLTGEWLAERHGVPGAAAAALGAAAALAERAAAD